ncbi:unnamed protein product [Camellia sinensis]
MGTGSLMNYAVEKSKELPAAVGNMGADLMGKAEEKWKELPVMAGNLMDKVEEVFPSETIKEEIQRLIQHLIQVCQPYIIPAIAAAVLIILLCCCGALFINLIIKDLAPGGKAIKMMIAPGTKGALVIVRSVVVSKEGSDEHEHDHEILL